VYENAVKCKSCKFIERRFHSAEFYNSFGKYICGNCGAGKGCWVDVTVEVVDNRRFWNPLTWRDVQVKEVGDKG